ncbi:AfsR/SARP family transcriptional regulator [Streptomyces sp. NPDC054794]
MNPAMSPLRTRLTAWLTFLAALAGLLIAADTWHPAPTGVCACAREAAATARAATHSPTPSLALHPGARLAGPKILALTFPAPALRQSVQDLTGTAPGHSQHPSNTHPGGPSAHIPATHTPANNDSTQTPQPSTSAFPPAPAQPSSPATASPATSASASHPPPSSPGRSFALYQALGLAALLAAALTGALTMRKVLRRHHRNNGAAPARTPHGVTPHALLRAAGEPIGAARLDLALRTLAHHTAQQNNGELPAVRAVRTGTRTLQVLPHNPAEQPCPPFTAGDAAGWWELPADATLLDPESARQVPAPYPGLVTLGHTRDGALVLVSLAQLPALLLEGDPVHITQVCTSLALEHAMSPWADSADLVTIGFGPTLPHLLPKSRLTHARHAAQALKDLTERLLEAHQHPELPHRPCLILSATALDADISHQLADLIEGTRTVPIALVAPASTARAFFPHAVILDSGDDQPQHLDLIGADITLQRVDDTAYARITTALTHTRQPPQREQTSDETGPRTGADLPGPDAADHCGHPTQAETASVVKPADADAGAGAPGGPSVQAGGARGDDRVFAALLAAVPEGAPRSRDAALHRSAARPHDEAASSTRPGSTAAHAHHPPAPQTARTRTDQAAPAGTGDEHPPEIRVLGPVEVDGVPHTGHGRRTTELAALLYFRPGRTADSLCTDMDPTTPWTTTTLNARLHGLRRALGNDPNGQPYVPRRTNADDPYQLHPDIRCDWTTFQHLTQHTPPAAEHLPRLETALALVRGRPFDGHPPPWAEPHQQEMTTSIIEVAHRIATQRTPPGPHHNLTLARQAIATGLEVDEAAEALYRAWMLIEHTAGNRAGLHMAITRLQHINTALDCPLEPETEQLINDLLHRTGPPQAHHP